MTKQVKLNKKFIEFFSNPGIDIPEEPNIPLYWVDDNNPQKILRKLNGIVDIGHMENGNFIKD